MPTIALGLAFFADGAPVATLGLEEMRRLAGEAEIELANPFTESPVNRYRALPLGPLLRSVYGDLPADDPDGELVFEASDGYVSFAPVGTALEDGGFVVFRDLDRPDGSHEPTGRQRASPGPFYVVWTGPGQTTANGYPWPYALASVRLNDFGARNPNVVPEGEPAGSPVRRGYLVFREQCFRCHAIDRQGGTIGPDLAAPRHVLDYRSEDFVREFIKNPESFRYSKMPPHGHLSEGEMDDLILYLKSRRR